MKILMAIALLVIFDGNGILNRLVQIICGLYLAFRLACWFFPSLYAALPIV